MSTKLESERTSSDLPTATLTEEVRLGAMKDKLRSALAGMTPPGARTAIAGAASAADLIKHRLREAVRSRQRRAASARLAKATLSMTFSPVPLNTNPLTRAR